MSGYLKSTAIALAIVLGVVIYREWILRNQPTLFLPLGFFEATMNVATPESESYDPRSWVDTTSPLVVDDAEFARLSQDAGAAETSVDVLVTGATFGGFAAALSAADDGVTAMLVDETDWKTSMRLEAANFIAQRDVPATPGSVIERELFDHIELSNGKATSVVNGTPQSIVGFFEERMATRPSLRVQDGHLLVALARGEDGKLNRALLRRLNSTDASVVRFSFLIDGTREGSGLAWAGVPTTSSWDAASVVAEPGALPSDALRGLTEGYSMSGRIVPGIGKRLENGTSHLGILDRGFHGTFLPIVNPDLCWEEDGDTLPFLTSGSVVLRTRTIGCTARATFESDYVDTVEVFAINYGSDSSSTAITFGRGTTVRVESLQDPKSTFVRLGAFPVAPGSPLTIETTSVLPTDKIEGFIVRKLNTGSPGAEITLMGDTPGSFLTADWRRTLYDVYLTTTNSIGVPVVFIDGTEYETERTGKGTYAVKSLPLEAGTHDVRAPDGEGLQSFAVVPVRPVENFLIATPIDDTKNPTWRIVPDRDADVLVAVAPEACTDECSYEVIEEESRYSLFREYSSKGSELIAPTQPMGVIPFVAGKSYLFIATGGYDERFPPMASPIDTSAVLYAIDNGSVLAEPPNERALYDVWVRSVRSSELTVSIGSRERKLPPSSDWQYVATEPLSLRGASAAGGGKIEVLAIPNVMIDAYHLTPLSVGVRSQPVNVPKGTYSVMSFGLDNPGVVTAKDDDGSIQSLSFVGRAGAYHTTHEYEHSSASVFEQFSPWPQRLVLYERISQPEDALSSIGNAVLFTMDPRPANDAARASHGTMLFLARPEGVGPVTIGNLGSASLEKRIRESVKDAFLMMRMGKTNINPPSACDWKTDPRCDMRRYVRDSSVFGTVDGLSPSVSYPEGRRIVGLETLTTSGAYAIRQGCTTCFDECVLRTMSGSTCVLSESVRIPANAVLSVMSMSGTTHITSPREDLARTLPVLLRVLRRDKLLGPGPTYLEQARPARDTTITLGMLVSQGHENVLAGSTTTSATPAASKALRIPTTELAIGSAAGHIAAFSLRQERSPLWFILQSPDAIARLQRYLIDKGVRVLPANASDPFILKAIQRRMLDGVGAPVPAWTDEGMTFTTREVLIDETAEIFGEDVRTVREALERLPGSPAEKTSAALFRFGIENGFLEGKIFNLTIEEIMATPLDESFLLKADYLLRNV